MQENENSMPSAVASDDTKDRQNTVVQHQKTGSAVQAMETAIERIDAISKACSSLDVAQGFRKALTVAQYVKDLRMCLTPQVMTAIMELQNSPLGFLTDRAAGGYDAGSVRECVIWATLQGLPVAGNCFNIIAGRGYATKNGLKYKLGGVEGLAYSVVPGLPKALGEAGAAIEMTIRWDYKGSKGEQVLTFTIRVNKGMGADAIIGKATRKSYAWLYEQITGNYIGEGDATERDPMVITPKEERKGSFTPPKPALKRAPAAAENAEDGPLPEGDLYFEGR